MEQLFSLSQFIAQKKPLWVQGKGGNLSFKDRAANQLQIKATGLRLEEIDAPEKMARLKMAELKTELSVLFNSLERLGHYDLAKEKKYAEILGQFLESNSRRASMETGFHLALEKEFVIHFHPVSALLIAYEHAKNFAKVDAFLKNYFSGSIAVIPRVLPGLLLSATLAKQPGLDCYILENHGVVLQTSTTPDLILKEWEALEAKFLESFGYRFKKISTAPLKIYFPDTAVFLKELVPELIAKGQEFGLSPEAPSDLKEIWEATLALYSVQPNLAVWSAEDVANMSAMPVEQIRKLS